MKKEKMSLVVTTGIACFILTMIMFMQFKIVYETDISSLETMREEDLKQELVNWKTKYEETEQRYEEIEQTLNKYKEESTSNSQIKQNLEEELENLNLMLGATDVEGTGIIITLQDSDDQEEKITAEELMMIVNYLKDAGAEAISINDQRIINSTYITLINNSFIKINSQKISSPYEIKAIGDSEYLKSSLVGNGGYAEKITNLGKKIKIEEKRKVYISKYDKELSVKYIKQN